MGTSRGSSGPNSNAIIQDQRNISQGAINQIQPTPYQQYSDTRNLNLLQGLDSGKDVSDISELSPELNLYNSSVANNQNYAGEGLLSPNALSGGNAAQIGLIGQQIASRRQQQAAGDLYNSVQAARQNAVAGGQWGAQLANQQNEARAGMQNQEYSALLGRPQNTPFWQTLLTGAESAAGQIGGGWAQGGFKT